MKIYQSILEFWYFATAFIHQGSQIKGVARRFGVELLTGSVACNHTKGFSLIEFSKFIYFMSLMTITSFVSYEERKYIWSEEWKKCKQT